MKIKEMISTILAFSLVVSMFVFLPIEAKATDTSVSFSGEYIGYYDSATSMEFSVYSIDVKNNTFSGNVKLNDSTVSINENVNGNVILYDSYYECSFSFSYRWIFGIRYDASFTIVVDPFVGVATGSGGGGHLLYNDSIHMEGTINAFYNRDLSYNDDDMKLCMALSNAMYDSEQNETIQHSLNTLLEDLTYGGFENIKVYNYSKISNNLKKEPEGNKDNVAFALLSRKNSDDSVDIIVSIRGTYYDEWLGNLEITGEEYDSSVLTHDNFNKAKDSIIGELKSFYEIYNEYDEINLIVTGHSRGAAVANLLAKDATDIMNNPITTDEDNDESCSIPHFDNVRAYTFACPNVTKITSTNTEEYMSSYDNIFNFWFNSDIVPSVPLSYPERGWGYWKYGKCYTMDISDAIYAEDDYDYIVMSSVAPFSNLLNFDIHKQLRLAFLQWNSVEKYYNLDVALNGITFGTGEHITLYQFLNELLYMKSTNNSFSLNKMLNDFAVSGGRFAPLAIFAINNLITIAASHSNKTYYNVINGNNLLPSYGSSLFSLYSYSDAVGDSQLVPFAINDEDATDNISFDSVETQKLVSFANSYNNNEILNWNLSDPSTWNGISWNDEGHVVSIELPYMWLSGNLDCSNFTSLENVNVYANLLTNIDLSGASNLISLNCSCNDLSQNGLDVSDCENLIELYCDGCGLVTLDLSGVTLLQKISSSFNNLIALNIEDNLELEYISCSYNYLDTHEGGVLYTQLANYRADNNAYINCFPQRLPSNAIIDLNELQMLEDFAKIENNNSALDWLDDDGNISLDKVQKNVYFEYSEGIYRIVALDISQLNVIGDLDMSAFTKLRTIYCKDTKITSLDLEECTELQYIRCDCSQITRFILPSNAAITSSHLNNINCEYNYIDTSIFTNGIVDNIESKDNYVLKYLNQRGDSTALQAAMSFAKTLNAKDYSEDSYDALKELLDYCDCYDFENLCISQNEIDNLTADILTAIYNLKAYFNVNVGVSNGSLSIAYDDETSNDSGTYSILYGTPVTLNATADNDCTFVGWYDTVSNRYLSNDAQYSFKVDSNINLKAVIIPNGSTTLTFANYSNWIAGTITKTTTEWAELTSIEDLLPNVPYRYGYSNGRWVYNDSAVLALLQSGQDVNIGAEYDEDNASFPTPRVAIDKPVLDLYYNYDSDNLVGSFVMAAGFPEDIEVESVGIAFYYKKANQFDPTDNFTLLLNNKMVVGRFNTDVLEDVYITNMNNMTSTYNWAARGYVTYYDESNNLVTAYSNQINVIDTRNANEIPVETFSLPEEDLDDDIPPVHTDIDVLNSKDD